MRSPIFVVGDRATGKTVKAIAEAESVGGLIAVANRMMVDFTMRLAQEHNMHIMQPMTHADLLYPDKLRGLNHTPIILDDADVLFRSFLGRYYPNALHMMTWSVDVDRYQYLQPMNMSVLEQLQAFRKDLPTYDTTVPVTRLWDLEKENQDLRRALEKSKQNEYELVAMLAKVMERSQARDDE
jgi:hypothetical protein